MNDSLSPRMTWRILTRIIIKATFLFGLCNFIYALVNPLETLGRISLYNTLLPGRDRLPYGEQPDQSYNISLFNLPAMFASHTISQPKSDDEFRLLILGDSGVWGWYLDNSDTLAGHINRGNYHHPDGRRITAYNLGYPVMSLTKDLLLMQESLSYQPDMILWLVTLESFPPAKQLVPPLVQHNPDRIRRLIDQYNLNILAADPRLVDLDWFGRTIIGQRRQLADLLRLQTYGFSWAATGIDQFIPTEFSRRQSDFEADLSWQNYAQPTALETTDLAFDVLEAGIQMSDDIPVIIVNEPIFISTGQNSDLRYNSWYPRWAYDAYRDLLAQITKREGWLYFDLWDIIPPEEFTDSPVHLTPAGAEELADRMSTIILTLIKD